jgi:hypothetical protein
VCSAGGNKVFYVNLCFYTYFYAKNSQNTEGPPLLILILIQYKNQQKGPLSILAVFGCFLNLK